ncbi:MAG: hypothetical protein WCO49_20670 [Nostocales cyanobacterium ELA608]
MLLPTQRTKSTNRNRITNQGTNMIPSITDLLNRLDEIERALFTTSQKVEAQHDKIMEIHQVFMGLATVLPGFNLNTVNVTTDTGATPYKPGLVLEL